MSDDDKTFSVDCDCGRTLHITDGREDASEKQAVLSWPKELTKLVFLVVGALGDMVHGTANHIIGLIQLKSNPNPDQEQKPESGSGMLNEG